MFDQESARAIWMTEHGLSDDRSLAQHAKEEQRRIDEFEKARQARDIERAARAAQAAQDVAQVVAMATAAAAIEQASESAALQEVANTDNHTELAAPATTQADAIAHDAPQLETVCADAQEASHSVPGCSQGHAGTTNSHSVPNSHHGAAIGASGHGQAIKSRSGNWSASFFIGDDGRPALQFNNSAPVAFDNGRARMQALQAMARNADTQAAARKAADAAASAAAPGGQACAKPDPSGPVLKINSETPQDQGIIDGLIKAGFPRVTAECVAHNGIDAYGKQAQDEITAALRQSQPDQSSLVPNSETPQDATINAAPCMVPVNAPPLHPRRYCGGTDALHYIEPDFEAWTYSVKTNDKFGFVMYIGKSSKPYAHYVYKTAVKRDEAFNRHATQARELAAYKLKRKADNKAEAEKPHGLKVGDVVRNSWGYDQTNVEHYQIVKVVGKRTVEIRQLDVHHEDTGYMTGRVAPIAGVFVGEIMRRQVDRYGSVNIYSASYGRASKIEPVAVVHGVRAYAASNYSSYA